MDKKQVIKNLREKYDHMGYYTRVTDHAITVRGAEYYAMRNIVIAYKSNHDNLPEHIVMPNVVIGGKDYLTVYFPD